MEKLGFPLPLTVGEVSKVVELLKEKKEEFLEKRKVKKERIAAGLEDLVTSEEGKEDEKGRKNGKKNKNKKKGGSGKMLVDGIAGSQGGREYGGRFDFAKKGGLEEKDEKRCGT